MDNNKPSGIRVEQIELFGCNLAYVNNEAEKKFNLAIVNLQRSYNDDKTTMFLFVSFDVMFEVEDPLCAFTCDFVAIYEMDKNNPNMTWTEFKDALAIAHIIPYLREFISNITNRMPIPILNIPPVNTFLLVEDYEKREKEKELSDIE
jgi:preprotein translocase subunit SecB